MYKKFIIYFALFLVSLTAVFAANTVTLDFYDEDSNSVNNVEVSVFECTDKTCESIVTVGTGGKTLPVSPLGSLGRVDYADTGRGNTATLSIPAQTEKTYFIAYAFAEESDTYLPAYQIFWLDGDGWSGSDDVTLEKKDVCTASIQTFTVPASAEPNEAMTFNVEAASALELTGVYPYGMYSSQYSDWYKTETDVEFTITRLFSFGSESGKASPFESESESPLDSLFDSTHSIIVYSDTETLNILAEETETAEFSWTPTREGTYTATVTTYVTDSQCESSEEQSESEQFTVEEEAEVTYAPVADAGGSIFFGYVSYNDYDVTFDGSGSYDTDPDGSGYIVSYEWDFGDGSTDTGVNPTHTYDDSGIYTATLTVTDNDGLTDTDAAKVHIWIVEIPEPEVDLSPYASCGGPYTASLGEAITFDGTGYDPDGGDVTFSWDFGDGSTSTDEDPEYTYSAEGTYTVTLIVVDDEKNSATCTTTATITEEVTETAPTAECSGPYDEAGGELLSEGTVGQELFFEGDGYDEDGGDVTFSWDFNGDSVEDSTSDDEFYTYDEQGTYTATFTVTDDEGETAQCSLDVVIVEEGEAGDNPAVAVASAEPTSGEPTLWVQFSSEGSSGDEPLSLLWEFGNGESSSRENPGYYYDDEGSYTATLTVTDTDGDTDTATVIITVADELENIASLHYYLEGIAFGNDGRVSAGDELEIWISAESLINKEDVTFNAVIQELGIYETSGEFDIDAGNSETKVLSLSIPEGTEPGTYYVRLTISDDVVKRVIYRDIIVTV